MKKNLHRFTLLLFILHALSPTYACDNTPLLVVYDPVEIAGGQWDLEVFVCFGSEESEDGFTLESTGGVVNIVNSTPNVLENPYNGNIASSIFSGGVLNYYYDNTDGSNYNDADGETGPCVDFQITVDANPIGTSFTMAGVNDGCDYTISTDHLTSEVTFTQPCLATQSMIAPGTISGTTENAPTNCNFRSPVFSTVKENIIEVEVPCEGEYTFSLCGSSFDTWMALSYECCFLPFASNDNFCSSQSEITVDLLAGTYYVLVEGFLWDDFGDYTLTVTSSTDAVSIDTIDLTEPQCAVNDAEIVIHAAGTDPPYSYSIDGGSTFSSDSVFSNLSGGNYFIVVESSSGCIASTLFSINTNPPLILDSVQTSISACNAADGELIIHVSNGALPYEYSIDNGLSYQSSNVFSNLAGGNYLLSAVDLNGCEVNSPFFLDSSSVPVIQDLIISEGSCGLASGQLEIIASGDSPLTYSIDGINYQNSNVFSALIGGNYNSVSVQNANGCVADTSVFISNVDAPNFDQINISSSACDTSGSVEIIVSGGGSNYMYSIDGGLNYVSSNTFSNVLTGNYTIAVMDDNLCVIDSLIFVDQLSSLSLDAIILTDPTCDPSTGNISTNGSIEITATGGISTINYSINGGSSFQTSNIFSSLSYGAYQVVIDDGTCLIDSLVSLSTNPGPTIEILDARDLSCGEENGFIAVKVLNATNPDYNYQFDNGVDNIQSGPTSDDQYSYDQLSEGIWNIIVSDGDGCIADTAVDLGVSADIAITDILIDSVFCNQNNGAFTILASSGNLPIEYSLTSDFSNAQGNGYFNGLSAGTYTIYLRDDRFCLDTVIVNLSNADGVVIDSLQSVNPTCFDHNGELTIYASEGTAPYFYSIDNGLSFQSGNYFSGLHDELYEIMVVDATGCVSTTTITLIEEGGITLDVELVPLNCGLLNGEIIMTATGGDNNFTYTIDSGTPQSNTSGLFTGLSSGFYDVDVVDGQGCTDYANVFLDSLSSPSIDSVSTIDAGCGGPNGSLSIFVSGGQSPYSYSIDSGNSYNDSATFNGLSPGNYNVFIQDSLFCADSIIVNIATSAEISIDDLIINNPSCGDSSGSILAIVIDASPPLQFILSDIDTNTTGSFDELVAGSYLLTVIDDLGCTTDSLVVLTDILAPNPPAQTMADFYSCFDNLIISANDPMGSTAQWTIISGGASLSSTTDSSTLASGLSLGLNQFVWTISNADCPSTTDTLSIELIEEIIVDAGEDVYKVEPVPVQLTANSDIPGDFSWVPANVLSDATVSNPVAIVESSTLFIVTVSNNYGCEGVDSVWIYIEQDIVFASAFTPNNDGNNDTWVIENIEFFPNAQVTIMNRYGNVVFESKGYNNPWDGTYDGQDLPVGSYFYIIDLGDDFETKTGSISVIR